MIGKECLWRSWFPCHAAATGNLGHSNKATCRPLPAALPSCVFGSMATDLLQALPQFVLMGRLPLAGIVPRGFTRLLGRAAWRWRCR